ncbi:hypothetical protein SAMN05421639_101135 [Chryseobacterium shigense]|uniref:Uncharacterized protein n=1 Tax=Chryseobacterium shigense TaxID=297244 RepID=A0A1N7HU07_9FLAO|nr:hypothetical protein SAMN05421639_101135 [Chryseobacterium shigense]
MAHLIFNYPVFLLRKNPPLQRRGIGVETHWLSLSITPCTKYINSSNHEPEPEPEFRAPKQTHYSSFLTYNLQKLSIKLFLKSLQIPRKMQPVCKSMMGLYRNRKIFFTITDTELPEGDFRYRF